MKWVLFLGFYNFRKTWGGIRKKQSRFKCYVYHSNYCCVIAESIYWRINSVSCFVKKKKKNLTMSIQSISGPSTGNSTSVFFLKKVCTHTHIHTNSDSHWALTSGFTYFTDWNSGWCWYTSERQIWRSRFLVQG